MKPSSTAKSELRILAIERFSNSAKKTDTEVGQLDCEMEVYFQAFMEAFVDFSLEFLDADKIKRDNDYALALNGMSKAFCKCLTIARFA